MSGQIFNSSHPVARNDIPFSAAHIVSSPRAQLGLAGSEDALFQVADTGQRGTSCTRCLSSFKKCVIGVFHIFTCGCFRRKNTSSTSRVFNPENALMTARAHARGVNIALQRAQTDLEAFFNEHPDIRVAFSPLLASYQQATEAASGPRNALDAALVALVVNSESAALALNVIIIERRIAYLERAIGSPRPIPFRGSHYLYDMISERIAPQFFIADAVIDRSFTSSNPELSLEIHRNELTRLQGLLSTNAEAVGLRQRVIDVQQAAEEPNAAVNAAYSAIGGYLETRRSAETPRFTLENDEFSTLPRFGDTLENDEFSRLPRFSEYLYRDPRNRFAWLAHCIGNLDHAYNETIRAAATLRLAEVQCANYEQRQRSAQRQ